MKAISCIVLLAAAAAAVAQRPLAATSPRRPSGAPTGVLSKLPPEVAQSVQLSTPPASGPIIIPTNAKPVPLRSQKPASRGRGSVKFMDVLKRKNPEINEQKLQQLQLAAAKLQTGRPARPAGQSASRTRTPAANRSAPRPRSRSRTDQQVRVPEPSAPRKVASAPSPSPTQKDGREDELIPSSPFKNFKPVTKLQPLGNPNKKPITNLTPAADELESRKEPLASKPDASPKRNRLASLPRSRPNKRPVGASSQKADAPKNSGNRKKVVRKSPRRLVPLKRPFAKKPLVKEQLIDEAAPTLDANDDVIITPVDDQAKKEKKQQTKLDDEVDVSLVETLMTETLPEKSSVKEQKTEQKEGMIVGEFTVKSPMPKIVETTLQPETTTQPSTTVSTTISTTTTSEKPRRGRPRASRPSNRRSQGSPQRATRTRVSTGAVRVAPVAAEVPASSSGRRGSRGNSRAASRVVAPSQPAPNSRVRIRTQSARRQRPAAQRAAPSDDVASTTARPNRRRG